MKSLAVSFLNPVEVQQELEQLSDDDLIEAGRSFSEDAFDSFLKLCCTANIAAKRHEGLLRRLANELGISYSKASEMSRIWERIVVPLMSSGQNPPPLEQSFYHEALNSPSPEAAIQIAWDMKNSDPNFSVRKFRRILRQQGDKKPEEVKIIRSCKTCRFYQELDLSFTVKVAGVDYQLYGKVLACRIHGILGVVAPVNHEAVAENCQEFAP